MSNRDSKEIISVTEKWLESNADNLPLEVRLLLYKAIEDEKKYVEECRSSNRAQN